MNGSLVLFLLHPGLELQDLVLKQFFQESAKLVDCEFASLILVQFVQNFFVFLLETSISLTLDLGSWQKVPDKWLDLLTFDASNLICVDGVIDVAGHLHELVIVNQNIGQILDGLFVVDDDGLSFRRLSVVGHLSFNYYLIGYIFFI